MNSSNPARRTILIAFAGTLVLGVLALVVLSAFALWRLTEWGSGAIDKVTDATVAAVSLSREEATRVLEDAKGSFATSVAAVALSKEEAARALQDAKASVATTRERAKEALANPEGAVQRAADAAAQDVSRTLAAAVAAVAPVVSGHAESAARSLEALAARDPTSWPEGLALKQTHFRQLGGVTEYAYVAVVPDFRLNELRAQLVDLGYTEHVIAEGEGSLEAVYRGDHQLLLSATTRKGRQHIDVREVPLAVTDQSGP